VWNAVCDRYPDEPLESRLRRYFVLMYEDEPLARRATELMKKRGMIRDEPP
jgi:hypothetical protein